MIKGVLFAFLAAFSWGAAIVMSKKGLENMDAGGLFFWQVGSAAMLSWFVLAISRKKLPVTKISGVYIHTLWPEIYFCWYNSRYFFT